MNRQSSIVVAGTALAYNYSGVAIFARRLLRGLARAAPDTQIHLLIPEHTGLPEIPDRIKVTRTPRRLHRRKPILSEIFTAADMGRYASRFGPHSIFITPGDFWTPFAIRRRLAVTHDAQPEVDRISRGSAIRHLYRKLCIRYARKSDVWATISHYAADEIATHCRTRRRPSVFSNWMEDDYRRPAAAKIESVRRKLNLPDRFILYVGGYRRYKNVEFLIEAFANAGRRHAIPPLVLAGNIPPPELAAALGNIPGAIHRAGCPENSVITPGHIEDADMPALYAAASLFVSPSLHEGFGYPPVEAMAVGCPVLVADRTSFREVVPHAHARFDPDSQEQLVTRLIEACQHPERFRFPLPHEYTEQAGIARYLDAIRSLDV